MLVLRLVHVAAVVPGAHRQPLHPHLPLNPHPLIPNRPRFIGWIETSAKEDVNVEKAMVYLIKHILALDDDNYEAPSQKSVCPLSLPTIAAPILAQRDSELAPVLSTPCLHYWREGQSDRLLFLSDTIRLVCVCVCVLAINQLVVTANSKKQDKPCCPT